jgi:hypothetical protein
MKAPLLTVCVFSFAATSLLAQGRINFSNTSVSPLRISNGNITQVLGTASTATFGIGPASVRISLFAGLNSTSLAQVLIGSTANQLYVTNTASTAASFQGLFAGGNNLVLPFDGTQPVYLQFRADSINGSYINFSPIILVNLATGASPATTVFGATASSSQWDGLTIGPLPSPPWIYSQPQSQTVVQGGNFSLSVGVAGTGPLFFQWQHFGTNIPGATTPSYSVTGATLADAGDYKVFVTNSFTQPLVSTPAIITIGIPLQFDLHPASQIVPLHGTATFSALANGSPAPHYQWLFNGNAIPGANATSLVLTNIGTNLLGGYSVVVANSLSVVTSSAAGLYMSPSLRSPFTGATVVWGKEALLSVSAVGSGELVYQWYQNGVPVLGGTNASLIFPSIQFTNGGLYSVVVTSAFGSVSNTPAQLVINPANTSLGFYAGITIDGVPGYTYGIESSTNLSDLNAWVAITNVTLIQPVQLWIDTSVESRAPGNNGRFYRVTAP